jgi:predicted phosphodiesterase
MLPRRIYIVWLILGGLSLFATVPLASVYRRDNRTPSENYHASYYKNDKPFTFVVFGDNRPSNPRKGQPPIFRKILSQIAKFQPAFVVNTGDCIYGAPTLKQVEKQYKDYKDTVSSLLTSPVYLTVGNHEIQGSKQYQDFFEKELGGLYYSFDFGNSHFTFLNSEIVGQEHKITGEQLEWLKQDLYKARAACHKFVFIHQPLYPVNGHKGRCLDKYPDERDALHKLFVRNRVTAVFAGHEHLFHSEQRNGVWYIITGGAGAPLYPSYKLEGDFNHYVVVSVKGKEVEIVVIKLGEAGKADEILPITTPRPSLVE